MVVKGGDRHKDRDGGCMKQNRHNGSLGTYEAGERKCSGGITLNPLTILTMRSRHGQGPNYLLIPFEDTSDDALVLA
jgi:hypothetical protein